MFVHFSLFTFHSDTRSHYLKPLQSITHLSANIHHIQIERSSIDRAAHPNSQSSNRIDVGARRWSLNARRGRSNNRVDRAASTDRARPNVPAPRGGLYRNPARVNHRSVCSCRMRTGRQSQHAVGVDDRGPLFAALKEALEDAVIGLWNLRAVFIAVIGDP